MFSDPKHKKYAQYAGLGLEIAVALSAPIIIGFWLDGRYDSSPWLTLAGIFLGLVLMLGIFSGLIRKMNKPDS